MKRYALSLVVALMLLGMAQTAQAQWVRYQPMWVAPAPVRVYRAPVVMYQPTRVVYTRQRPILGGTVVRTRPAYRRVVW